MRGLYSALLLAAFLGLAVPAWAQTKATGVTTSNPAATYECALSGPGSGGLSECSNSNGGGTNTSASAMSSDGSCSGGTNMGAYCGARSDPGNAVIPITDSLGNCYWVDNASSKSIFVPFKSENEWTQFTTPGITPSGITLIPCSFPAGTTETVNGKTIVYGSTTQTYPTATSPLPSNYPPVSATGVTNPTVYGYYMAPGGGAASLWPTTPAVTTFTSSSGANTVQALLQWTAANPGSLPQGQTLQWTLTPKYSPLVTLTAKDPNVTPSSVVSTADTGASGVYPTLTITNGDSVTITPSTSSAYSTNAPQLSSYSGTHWDGTSKSFVPPINTSTNYTVTYVDSNNLASTATITINSQTVPTCGTASTGTSNHFTAAPSSNLCNSSSLSGSVGGSSNAGGWYWTCKSTDGSTTQCPATVGAQCPSTAVTVTGLDANGNPVFSPSNPCGSETLVNVSGNTTNGWSYECQTSYTYNGITATDTTGSCTTAAYSPPPKPVVTLTASPTSITAGASSTLTWTITGTGVTSCLGNSNSGTFANPVPDPNFNSINLPFSGTLQATVSPTVTTLYWVTCANSTGYSDLTTATTTAEATVTVVTPSVIVPPACNYNGPVLPIEFSVPGLSCNNVTTAGGDLKWTYSIAQTGTNAYTITGTCSGTAPADATSPFPCQPTSVVIQSLTQPTLATSTANVDPACSADSVATGGFFQYANIIYTPVSGSCPCTAVPPTCTDGTGSQYCVRNSGNGVYNGASFSTTMGNPISLPAPLNYSTTQGWQPSGAPFDGYTCEYGNCNFTLSGNTTQPVILNCGPAVANACVPGP